MSAILSANQTSFAGLVFDHAFYYGELYHCAVLKATYAIAEDGALSPAWIEAMDGYVRDVEAVPGAQDVASVLDPPPGIAPDAWAGRRFTLTPARRVLTLAWPVQTLREACDREEPLPVIAAAPTTLLVYRRAGGPAHA